MKKFALCLVAAILIPASYAKEACTLGTVLGARSLSDFSSIDKLPEEAKYRGTLESVPLYCAQTSIVSDAFGYTAFFSRERNLGWVHQYGGIAGVYRIYGPIPMAPNVIAWCIENQQPCPDIWSAKSAKPAN